MQSRRRVCVVTMEGREAAYALEAESPPTRHALGAPLRRAIARTRQWLLDEQHPDGHWCGELEGDTILESEYILLLAYLGRHRDEEAIRAARWIERHQLPDGGWTTYPGGAVDVSVSVKAYFALKLTGSDPASEPLQRARAAIMAHGGADAVNSFTRFYLALLGQISYDQCPAVPPVAALLPQWFPINIYRISAWSRTMFLPLAVVWAHKPVRQLEPAEGIGELFLRRPDQWPELRCPGKPVPRGWFTWDRFFRFCDRAFKFCDRRGLTPLRQRALGVCERWIKERFDGSEGLGAIFPPMIWSIIALKCQGSAEGSPELEYCWQHLRGLIIEEGDALRLQPCKSPVWDTAIALRALAAAGLSREHEAAERAVDWLLSQEVRRRGDWTKTVQAEPSGWCFEYANEFYPDVDDTVMVMMALRSQVDGAKPSSGLPPALEVLDQSRQRDRAAAHRRLARVDRIAQALARGERWVRAMQNRDGGWGAFDRDNHHEFLCHVPFADHNAMIDPSTPDLAGRTLEMLGHLGRRLGDAAVDRAVAYLRRTQEADGSWFGRWGVNYIYGVWQTLVGLRAVGVAADDPMVVAGAQWLVAHQQPSGGWGESPDSYADPSLRGRGNATASQTAWALLGLMACGLHDHPAAARGVRWLLETQQTDGTWDEPEFTGTGFPQVFYLRYHLYRIYFPLLALGQWAQAVGQVFDAAETLHQRLADASLQEL